MEENRNSSPMDVCEKIYKAICCISNHPQDPIPASPAPNPSLPASSPAVKTHDINREAAGVIPINFDSSSLPAPPNGNGNIQKHSQVPQVAPKMEPVSHIENPSADMAQPGKLAKVASKIGPEPPQEKAPPPTQHHTEGGKKTGIHIEDRFTDYINRAKIKIRTVSNVGDGKTASGVNKSKDHQTKDHQTKDHHFSDYIARARNKLRTTSGIGGGRSESK